MSGKTKKATMSICAFFTILAVSLFLQHASAGNLELTIVTEERCYVGEGGIITIYGNLTADGSPVSDSLVSIQTIDSKGDTYAMRTVTMGSPLGPWLVEIVEVAACDSQGNPKSAFERGSYAGFKVSVRNNGGSEQKVAIPLTIVYSDEIPFITFVIYNATLSPGATESVMMWPIEIPGNAPLGVTTIYASALTKWPKDGGIAYCPEKAASFTIISEGEGSSTDLSRRAYSMGISGAFNISFRISDHGGRLGTYKIYAAAHRNFMNFAAAQETFEAVLVADITGRDEVPDGKVNMMDVYTIIQSFGSKPGDPNWNPLADIAPVGNPDSKINMKDIYKAIKDFGKYGQP